MRPYLRTRKMITKDLRKPGYSDRDLKCEILSMFIFAYTEQSKASNCYCFGKNCVYQIKPYSYTTSIAFSRKWNNVNRLQKVINGRFLENLLYIT